MNRNSRFTGRRVVRFVAIAVLLSALCRVGGKAYAQGEPTPSSGNPQKPTQPDSFTLPPKALLPYEIGLQATLIDQQLFKFHSPYSGPLSLRSRVENEKSDTYTLILAYNSRRDWKRF